MFLRIGFLLSLLAASCKGNLHALQENELILEKVLDILISMQSIQSKHSVMLENLRCEDGGKLVNLVKQSDTPVKTVRANTVGPQIQPTLPGPVENITAEDESPSVNTDDDKRKLQDEATVLLPKIEAALDKAEETLATIQQKLAEKNMVEPEVWLLGEIRSRDLKSIYEELLTFAGFLQNHEVFSSIWSTSVQRYESLKAMIERMSKKYRKCSPGYKGIKLFGCFSFHLKEAVRIEEAILACREDTGDLLEIDSWQEYQTILNMTKGTNVWLGIKSDFMGNWRWLTDNRISQLTDWYSPPRRRDGKCAYIDNTGQTGWINYHCSGPRSMYRTSYICKANGQSIEELLGL